MGRHRYGVALLFDRDACMEMQGLRRAFGGHLRIEPHITLVSPINLADRQLDAAMDAIKQAAYGVLPLELTIGPADTFAPTNPVVYLGVHGGEHMLSALHGLQHAIHQYAPFVRIPTHTYVPHVTINEDTEPDSISTGLRAFQFFSLDVTVDRIWLLWEHPTRRVWERVSDVTFETPPLRGRGGFELSFRTSQRPGPGQFPAEQSEQSTLAIEASHDGKVVGALMITAEIVTVHVTEGYESYGIDDRLHTELSRF